MKISPLILANKKILMDFDLNKWKLRRNRYSEQYKQDERLKKFLRGVAYDKENENCLYKGVQKKKDDIESSQCDSQISRKKYMYIYISV